MILEKSQINRYLRHILMPGISGRGQKKILESSIMLICEELNTASLPLYYLVATGVGQVYCRISNPSGWEELYSNLSDLNSDVKVQLQTEEAFNNTYMQIATRIIAGNPDFVKRTLNAIEKSDCRGNYIPTIVSIFNGWCGAVRTFAKETDLMEFSTKINNCMNFNPIDAASCSDNISGYFSSLIAVIEHIKLVLSLGKPMSDALYYDLSSMDFEFINSLTDLLYKLLDPRKYEKSTIVLSDSKVLIVGCGGLGSPAAFALASLGIGKLGLVDYDVVELSNLNRQIMHSASRIGMSKVQSAEIFIKGINPKVELELYDTRIDNENIHEIISSYDIVIGGLDNLAGRYLLNDACYTSKKPLIEAGALDISGLATSIIPESGHCYRCIFPETEDESPVPSCSEAGVLGPVPGIMGIVQAAEAIKLLTGIGKSLKNRILLFDVFDTDIYVADHGKNRYCKLCGDA